MYNINCFNNTQNYSINTTDLAITPKITSLANLSATPFFVAAAVCAAAGLFFYLLSKCYKNQPAQSFNNFLSKEYETLNLDDKIWYEAVIQMVKEKVKYRDISTITQQIQENYVDKVKKNYGELAKKHTTLDLMGENYGLGFCISFKMQGLSLIGSYLKQKHQLQNLYVCDSLEAFQHELYELLKVSQSKTDIKAAFVISTRGLVPSKGYMPENQHKATVCIEKLNGKLHIIYLDSEPKEVNEELLKMDISRFKDRDEDKMDDGSSFAVFWAIYHSGVDIEKAELFQFIKTREHAHYGCETFALKDAVAFLKTDRFLAKVKCNRKSGDKIGVIPTLPPQFMKTTQSMDQLTEYCEKNQRLANELIPRSPGSTKPSLTLSDIVKNNTRKGYNSKGELVDQNHYVSMISLKYHLMALKAMEVMSTEQLEKVIAETFVSVERPELKEGQEPKNVHQLYQYWSKKGR